MQDRKWIHMGLPSIIIALFLGLFPSTSAAKVKLTYMSWMAQSGRMEIEEEIVRLFNESQSEIEVEFLGVPGTQALYERVISMIAGGIPPDISALPSQFAASQLTDLAVDLTPFIERDGFDMSVFPDHQMFLVERQGRYFGVPWGYGDQFLFYNAGQFEEAGLGFPYYGWTVDEYIEAVRRTTRDRSGDGQPDVFGAENPGPWVSWAAMFDAEFIDPTTGKLGVLDPRFSEAINTFVDFWRQHGVVGGSFAGGSAATLVGWIGSVPTWNTQNLHESVQWRVSYTPSMPGGEPITWGHGHIMAVIKGSSHPEAAWEFIKFYNGYEAQAVLGRTMLYPTTRHGMLSLAHQAVLPPGYQQEHVFGPIFEPARAVGVSQHIPGAWDVYLALNSAITDVRNGTEAVESMVQRLYPVLETILAEAASK